MITPQALCEVQGRKDLVYDLDAIDGHEFEDAMAEVFRRMGYLAERGKLSNDHGRDIILRKDEQLVVVECKHQKSAVGRPIVQKLHSAAITCPNATDGFILTTGYFAPSAIEYVEELNAKSDLKIDLWDYQRLVLEARAVGVYFIASSHRTNIFFWVSWRADLEICALLQSRHLSRIKSAPRTPINAILISRIQPTIIPAVLVDYTVDRRFQTQVGTIYHAHDRGRRILGVDKINILPEEEQFWAQSSPKPVLDSNLDGRQVPTYFGQPAGPMVQNIRNEMAQRLSRRILYHGKNAQAYQKWCQVNPDDVDVQTKQVLYRRWKIELEAGPRRYEVHLADDTERDPGIVTTKGFSAGSAGFVLANGFLCNDCGLIVPQSGDQAGLACATCGRTLCRTHAWKWPDPFFRQSPRLCSTCYKSRQRHSEEFNVNAALFQYWSSILLACIPGVSLLFGKRYGASVLAFMVLACSLAVAHYRYPEPLVLLVCASLCWSLHWTSRLRLHHRNVRQLTGYRPDWH